MNTNKFQFRMREKEYPEVNEYVMTKVIKVSNIEATVELLEYNNKPGMILLSDYSRRRVRSANRVTREGKIEVLQVLHVDHQRGYIDLSKKDVEKQNETDCQENYRKSKTVHNIFSYVSNVLQYPIGDLYFKLGFILAQNYGNTFKGFQKLIDDDLLINTFDLPNEIKTLLMKEIRHQLIQIPVKCEILINVSCFTSEGILAIKKAFKHALSQFNLETLKIQIVAPPKYSISMFSLVPETTFKTLHQVVEMIRQEIKSRGGTLSIAKECCIIGC